MDAFDIAHYELENYEADDIIGTLANEADRQGLPTRIYTGDKDLLQLVSSHVHVCLTRKGITELEVYDPEKVKERYGLAPEQIIDLKGLMGDSSDNIPGVPGVGEKTALKLLHQFGSIANLYDHLSEVKGEKLREKLAQHKEQAELSRSLATITREAPLEVTLDDITYTQFDKHKVAQFFKELKFNSLLERIAPDAEAASKSIEPDAFDYYLLEEPDDSKWKEAFSFPQCPGDRTEKGRYHEAEIAMIALCNRNGLFAVV